MEDMPLLAEYGKSMFPEKNRVAIVAKVDHAYGSLREFDVYREVPEEHTISRVFRTRAKVLEWLSNQKHILSNHS